MTHQIELPDLHLARRYQLMGAAFGLGSISSGVAGCTVEPEAQHWFFFAFVGLAVASVIAQIRGAQLRKPAAIRLVQRETLWFVERRHAGKSWYLVGDHRGTQYEQTARALYTEAIKEASLERQRWLPGVEREITLIGTDEPTSYE